MVTTCHRNSTDIVALDAPYGQDSIQSTLSVDRNFDLEKPTLLSISDFPDGGLRAWSVVIGVSTMVTSHFCSNGLFPWIQALLMSFAT